MNFRTTLILLVVFVALGGVLFWTGRSSGAGANATATPAVTGLQLNAADVSAIVVRDSHGKQVRAERSGSTWKLAVPKAAPGDSANISTAVDSLAKLSATRTITLGAQGL